MLPRLIILLYVCICFTHSARILCYFPNSSKSHTLLALPIAEELANRGHDVTVISNDKLTFNQQSKYRLVVIKGKEHGGQVSEMMNSGKAGVSLRFFKAVADEFNENNVMTLKSSEFQKILHEASFDLVFFITAFFNNFQLGIADHFKAPWITFSTLGNVVAVRDLLGTTSLPATVPTRSAAFPSQMNFGQRLSNFYGNFLDFILTSYMEYTEEQMYNELWPNHHRSMTEMKRNLSVMFVNGHWIDSKKVRPTLPNEIEVGGIQINPTPKVLEPEVQIFLDVAEEGVILWTFGSNLPISKIDPQKLAIMMKVLGGLKQKVILKWEGDGKLPTNFMGRNWLAQDSILAHKNVKLFITHGGHGGSMEAMYHQVPILGIPFFGDQPANVAKAVADGWARGMTLHELTEENFSDAVADLLTNTRYQERVKEMSELYRDRLNSPLDEAVYWVEYVIKYNGAPHLTYAGRHLNFFQTYSLDVIGVLLLTGSFILIVARWMFLKLFKGNLKMKEE